MKLIPMSGYVTAEWVVIKDKEEKSISFDMLDEQELTDIEVALRVVNAGEHEQLKVGDLIMTGLNFSADKINPYGQLVPDNLIFAKIDAEGREVVTYVKFFEEVDATS